MKYVRGGVDGLDETSTGRVNRGFIIKQKIYHNNDTNTNGSVSVSVRRVAMFAQFTYFATQNN